MIIHTASEGITLAKKLETDSAAFYESLAKAFPAQAESFQAFAKENKKNIVNTERTYFGVITDALEGCYAFNLEADDYKLNTTPAKGADLSKAVGQAVKMEETVQKFYTQAAEQSKELMADVPRAFAIIARKRGERITKLKEIK
jgi:rubrerythrin